MEKIETEENTFVKILRKDRINMDRFVSVSNEAISMLELAEDTDVLALTISMNSPTAMNLIRAEKVTPEVFDKLVLMKKTGIEESDLKEQLASIQHGIWAHWMKYLFSVCKLSMQGTLIIPMKLVKQWERQMNTPYEKLSKKEQASDMEQVDKFWGLVVNAKLPEKSELLKEGYKAMADDDMKLLDESGRIDAINANQTSIMELGKDFREFENLIYKTIIPDFDARIGMLKEKTHEAVKLLKTWIEITEKMEKRINTTTDLAECLEMGSKEDVNWLVKLDRRSNIHKEKIEKLKETQAEKHQQIDDYMGEVREQLVEIETKITNLQENTKYTENIIDMNNNAIRENGTKVNIAINGLGELGERIKKLETKLTGYEKEGRILLKIEDFKRELSKAEKELAEEENMEAIEAGK